MSDRKLYRVKFTEKTGNSVVTLIATKVVVSEFFGLIAVENLVFKKSGSDIILPEEDNLRRKYEDTVKLHIPYHNVISIEEFTENKSSLKGVPISICKKEEDSSSERIFSETSNTRDVDA